MKKRGYAFIFMLAFCALGAFSEKKLTILPLPFNNLGSGEYSWIGEGMNSSFIADLDEITSVAVFHGEEMKTAFEEMTRSFPTDAISNPLLRICSLLKPDVLIRGSYLVSEDTIKVTVEIVDVRHGQSYAVMPFTAVTDGLLGLQRDMLFDIMREIQEIKMEGVTAPVITGPQRDYITSRSKRNPEAYRLYALGINLEAQDPQKAKEHYAKSIALDHEYVQPLIRMSLVQEYRMNETGQAIAGLEKAAGIMESRGEAETVGYSILLYYLGNIYTRAQKAVKGLEYYAKAIAMRESRGYFMGMNDVAVLEVMSYLSDQTGDTERALDSRRKALRIMESLNLNNTVGYAIKLNSAGRVLSDNWRLDESLGYFTRALELMKSLDGKASIEYAETLRNIGYVYWKKIDMDNALQYFTDAKKLLETMHETKSAAYANTLMALGNVYFNKPDMKAALDFHLGAKAVFQELGLDGSTGYAVLLMNMGNTYGELGESEKALECYMASKALMVKNDDTRQLNYGLLLVNLGDHYVDKEIYNQALAYFSEAKEFYQARGMEKSWDYANVLMKLGLVSSNKADNRGAIAYYRQSLAIQEKENMLQEKLYLRTNMDMGVLYERMGEISQALQYFEKARSAFEARGLPPSPFYATALKRIGDSHFKLRAYKQALDAYTRLETLLGKLALTEHAFFLDLFFSTARCYEELKDMPAAGKYFKKAVNAYDKAAVDGENKRYALKHAQSSGE